MEIRKLAISNYRNLHNQNVSFSDTCNFIVGENNLGKSNLLYLLQILCANRAFNYNDFTNVTSPIEVKLQLKLEDIEIGHFEDLFDTDDYHLINITCTQSTPDDNIEFHHSETNTFIRSSIVRCINFVYYDSLRNPVSEINFGKGKGVGRFLSNMIERYLEEKQLSDTDFINEEKVNQLLASINTKISRLKSFNDFKIKASSESEVESLLSKIVVLKDDKGASLSKSGYGVQFLILITLSILERIQYITEQRREKGIFEHETDSTKHISLILGLDEPEIHLHPYMQRSLIKYLNNIISNKNKEFQKLVKELFDIDGFNGQIIVATHSPNIILNDFTQIIRLYPSDGITKIKSGSEIVLDDRQSKRLHMHFPSIKEAFFSRCVIFVEGDSEESSFSHFSEKMSIDLDELGISVIQSRGGEVAAIKLLMQLVAKFDIPSVGVGDRDNNAPVIAPLYLTAKKDFEEELVSLVDIGRENFLEDLVKDFDGADAVVQAGSLNKYAVKAFKVKTIEYTNDLKLSEIPKTDTTNLKAFYLTWLSGKKSYPLGKLIGESILEPDIPAIYKTVISKAVELSKK